MSVRPAAAAPNVHQTFRTSTATLKTSRLQRPTLKYNVLTTPAQPFGANLRKLLFNFSFTTSGVDCSFFKFTHEDDCSDLDFTSALRSLKEHFTVRTRLSNSADSDFVNIRTLMTDHGGKSSEIWPLMSHLVSSSLTVSSILWRVGILRIFDCCATYHSSQSINTL